MLAEWRCSSSPLKERKKELSLGVSEGKSAGRPAPTTDRSSPLKVSRCLATIALSHGKSSAPHPSPLTPTFHTYSHTSPHFSPQSTSNIEERQKLFYILGQLQVENATLFAEMLGFDAALVVPKLWADMDAYRQQQEAAAQKAGKPV